MKKFYNAGYYLMINKPFKFFNEEPKDIKTCSICINNSIFNFWCLSWTSNESSKEEQEELGISDNQKKDIQKWTDEMFEKGLLQWVNSFPSLELALRFKNMFFAHINNIEIRTIYFSESESNEFIKESENDNNGRLSLAHNLLKKGEESQFINEEFLGFDLIGIENDGSFHTFHCHDISKDLKSKFSMNLNKNGLFNEITKQDKLLEYLNDDLTGLAPVPWFIVKTKRVNYIE